MKHRAKAIYFLHGKCEENNKKQEKEKQEKEKEKKAHTKWNAES